MKAMLAKLRTRMGKKTNVEELAVWRIGRPNENRIEMKSGRANVMSSEIETEKTISLKICQANTPNRKTMNLFHIRC